MLKESPQSHARLGRITTPHGDIETPVFMPVGTQGSVKAMTHEELEEIGFQIILGNTYHLHLRPGEELIQRMGGLHRFIAWSRSMLTDSGGFQIFSLSKTSKIDDDGVEFRSHIDGSLHRLTPESSIAIQTALGADIIMAFDECPPFPADYDQVAKAVERTYAWAKRSKAAWQSENQALFGIVQGGVHEELRQQSLEQIAGLDFPGMAIGGVSVGESSEDVRRITQHTAPKMPKEKPRYLMGVGTPEDIRHAVSCGVDMFDCVLPTRLGRHAAAYTSIGRINLKSAQNAELDEPIDPTCECKVCRRYSRAYLCHLFRAAEISAYRLTTYHNLWHYARLMNQIRSEIADGAL